MVWVEAFLLGSRAFPILTPSSSILLDPHSIVHGYQVRCLELLQTAPTRGEVPAASKVATAWRLQWRGCGAGPGGGSGGWQTRPGGRSGAGPGVESTTVTPWDLQDSPLFDVGSESALDGMLVDGGVRGRNAVAHCSWQGRHDYGHRSAHGPICTGSGPCQRCKTLSNHTMYAETPRK